jgi:hypothetical protein
VPEEEDPETLFEMYGASCRKEKTLPSLTLIWRQSATELGIIYEGVSFVGYLDIVVCSLK